MEERDHNAVSYSLRILSEFFNVPQLFATKVVRWDLQLIVLIREVINHLPPMHWLTGQLSHWPICVIDQYVGQLTSNAFQNFITFGSSVKKKNYKYKLLTYLSNKINKLS